MEGLPRAEGGRAVVLKAETWNALVDRVNSQVVLDPNQFEKIQRGNSTYYRYRGGSPGAGGPSLGGGGGRFVPYIGGDEGTMMYFTPGCIAYCRSEQEDLDDSGDRESEQVKPVYPTLNGVGLDAEEPPGFSVAGKSGASVWLVVDRTRCPFDTFVPTEEPEEETDRIEVLNKGQKPDRVKGRRTVLLCEMDFLTGDGGSKTIDNLDQRWESDFPVYFSCLNDKSDYSSGDEPGSSDVDSSDETDDSDPSSTGESKDCPWAAAAQWVGKRECYDDGKGAKIGWKVAVGITTLRNKCGTWKVCARFSDGRPVPFAGQTVVGGAICVPITSNKMTFGVKYDVEKPPKCTEAFLDVWIEGTPSEMDSDPDECCTKLPPKRFKDRWPRHCGSSCSTIAPPTP